MLCERLRAANAQVDQAIFHDLRHRLVVLLRQIAVLHGRVEKDMSIVDLDITQGNLAQMLGASREAVNKQLRALAKEGRIVIDGPRIQIFRTDPEGGCQRTEDRGRLTDVRCQMSGNRSQKAVRPVGPSSSDLSHLTSVL